MKPEGPPTRSGADTTPYLRPGVDLITAADAAEWLDTLHKGPPAERIFAVQDAVAALDARLDRERRQACRRGCFAMFREALVWRAVERKSCRGETWVVTYRARRVTHITRALAFRAAARQP